VQQCLRPPKTHLSLEPSFSMPQCDQLTRSKEIEAPPPTLEGNSGRHTKHTGISGRTLPLTSTLAILTHLRIYFTI